MLNMLLGMLLLLLSYALTEAQELQAFTQSGTVETYSLTKPLKISFDSSAFIFSSESTVLKQWGYGEIRKIVYANISTKAEDFTDKIEPVSLSVFPLPLQDKLHLSFEVPASGLVKLEMYSLKGVVVFSSQLGVFTKGQHITEVGFPPLPSGQYLLRLTGNSFSRSISIINL